MKGNILLIEDDKNLRNALHETLKTNGFNCECASSAEEGLVQIKKKNFDLILSDVEMPGAKGHEIIRSIHSVQPLIPIILMTAFAKIDNAVEAIKKGAQDYINKPFSNATLVEIVNKYIFKNSVFKPIYKSKKTTELINIAEQVAATDASVMITGPSGSGKEVLAQYIHSISKRTEGNFIAINCAAIPENMLESVLFGYEKGAFTGAVNSLPGKFELAQKGTILLDEITEMNLNLQSKILRVIQEREVERLGSKNKINLDVRIIATSNRNMSECLLKKEFREDLFYRLNVFPLNIPPLCERPEDITPIAMHLIEKHCFKSKIPLLEIESQALEKILSHNWPGNIRELENVIQRAIILADDVSIKVHNIIFDNITNVNLDIDTNLKHSEYQNIKRIIEESAGDKAKAAKLLGISLRSLRYKISKMEEIGIKIG